MNYQSSSKKTVQLLVDNCYEFGVKHVVISPGSRNAPLIISFDSHPAFTCYSIPDERSAAFYALGMARQLSEPVALVCTSGTAVLNYASALTEAFYQEIPLIAISADRPPDLIDQEDGQTIRQHNIFSNHIKVSETLSIDENEERLKIADSQIKKALHTAVNFPKGPVHINVPFNEPLYERCELEFKKTPITDSIPLPTLEEKDKYKLSEAWNSSEKIMLLCGVCIPNPVMNRLIEKLSQEKNILVMAPPTSNISSKAAITNIDPIFLSIKEEEKQDFKPDLLLTIGGPIVSKATKIYLRENKPSYHFDIDINPTLVNTYKSLTAKIKVDAQTFLSFAQANLPEKPLAYYQAWKQKQDEISNSNKLFHKNTPWCDLLVFKTFLQNIPREINLHLGNSTPVRYAELFTKHDKINYYCNRGTSGIDGCTSTAAGAALHSNKTTVLITGDISFFYDSNAFWNHHVSSNLKVILINNKGGNIFKVIPGPGTTEQLDPFFVTQQAAKAEKLCEAFNVAYLSASNENKFTKNLKILFESNKCTVLEVLTPSDLSAKVFKDLISSYKAH